MLRYVLAALLLPFPAIAGPRIAAVDAVVDPVIGGDTPGLAVLVTGQGRTLHMAGYGLADLETAEPVTEESIFDLASVSKQMTALLVAMQMEEGSYGADTPVADLLAALEEGDTQRPLTVGDLVHHLGGLPDYLNGSLDYDGATTNADVIAWLGGEDREAEPGAVFAYSNTGYAALGAMVAATDGMESLGDVLEMRVWGPLGMTDTALLGPADAGLAVTGYAGTGGDFTPAFEATVIEGDGNVFSNLVDLAKYEAALSEGALLQDMPALFVNGALDDGSAIDDDGQGYGFGWFLETIDGAEYALHSGSWMGTSTYYQRNLATGISVILLANGEDIDLDALALNIEMAVFD